MATAVIPTVSAASRVATGSRRGFQGISALFNLHLEAS